MVNRHDFTAYGYVIKEELSTSYTFLPLWLYLLTYPAKKYQADVTRQQRAQALVLKG